MRSFEADRLPWDSESAMCAVSPLSMRRLASVGGRVEQVPE